MIPQPLPERGTTAPALGFQLTADFHGCDSTALDDVERIQEWLLEAARRAGATIIGDHVHRFNPHGVSGAVILAESHLAIHTWPEHGFAALDLFTCGDVLQAGPALDYLQQVLSPGRVEVRKAERGMAATPNPGGQAPIQPVHVEEVGPGRRMEHRLRGPWLYDGVERLDALDGIPQRVQIGDFVEFGRGLVIDGEVQLAEGCDAAYTHALIWPAALRASSRRRWLIIGGGDGAAAREALRFTDTEEVLVVDVSRQVIEQTQGLIPSFWGGSQADPRLRVEVADGFALLRQFAAEGRKFDIIVFDLTDPHPAGSESALYSEEAFRSAADVLGPGGVFVAQLQELSALQWEPHRRQLENLRRVFRQVRSYRTQIEFFGYAQSFALACQEMSPWSSIPNEPVKTLLGAVYQGDWRPHWSQAWHEALFTLPPDFQAKLEAAPTPSAAGGAATRLALESMPLDEYTEVRESGELGLGLFATRLIPKGTHWWKAGQDNVLNVTKRQYDVLMRSELARSAASRQLLEAIQMYGYINDETNQVVVALDNSRFVNHSDTPNSDCAPEDPNNQAMANRDILPGEEICEDYRTYSMNTWDMPDEPYLR
jgi:spermidine synthase